MKKYSFICNGNAENLSALQNLLRQENISTEIKNNVIENAMGAEEILIALIGSAIIPSLISVIKVYLTNRSIELQIKDEETGKEISLKSKNGKIDGQLLSKLNSFFENDVREDI